MEELAIDSLPDGLARRLQADACEVFQLSGEPKIAHAWAVKSPYSTVFRVELDWNSERRHVYVKVPRKSPINELLLPARLAAEFRMLCELSKRFRQQPGLGVVEPFAHYPELMAIVTIEAPGEPLRRQIGKGARRLVASAGAQRQLREYATLCGHWLRRFHECTSTGTSAFDINDLVGYCTLRLATLQRNQDMRFEESLAVALLRKMTGIATETPAEQNPVAARHNDFASHNIIVERSSGIRVLDFTMVDNGSTYFDVCNFWLELETLKSDPTYSPTTLVDLQLHFLDAYGSLTPAHPLFALARCRYILNRLLTALNQRPKSPLSRIYRARVVADFHRWLRDFSQDV